MFDEFQGNHVVFQFQRKQLINELIDQELHLSETDLMTKARKLMRKQEKKLIFLEHFIIFFALFCTPVNFKLQI